MRWAISSVLPVILGKKEPQVKRGCVAEKSGLHRTAFLCWDRRGSLGSGGAVLVQLEEQEDVQRFLELT